MGSLDRVAQEIRLRRFAAAAVTSVMFAGLVWVADYLELMQPGSARMAFILILFCIGSFYLFIRSGLNASLADPSLTLPMILASSSVNTYVLYSLQGGRGAFLLIYFVSMLFGVFRLKRAELLAIAGFIITCFGTLLWRLHVEQLPAAELRIAHMQGVVLATVLIWFAFMGGYIGQLINRLGQADFDDLTGAYVRRRILEILRHEKLRADRSAGPLCVCLLDIDMLKSVNDNYGHQEGDEHLMRVARAVQLELRSIDYLGRYGGDEFLVVLSETDMRGALECAERIQRRLQVLNGKEGAPVATLSMGIAQYLPGEPLTHLVSRADAALYSAKSAGRDRIECAAAAPGALVS